VRARTNMIRSARASCDLVDASIDSVQEQRAGTDGERSFSVLYTSQLTVRTPSPIQPTLSPEKSPHNRCHESSRPLNPPSAQADDIIIRTKSHVMLSINIMSRLASTSRFSARFPGYNEPSNWPRGCSNGGGGTPFSCTSRLLRHR
jgi:hypothetical protein